MIENAQERINIYGKILYPVISPNNYVLVSEFIDLTVDYLNSKKEYSERSGSDKALGVFLIKTLWESYKDFNIKNINKYIDDFFKEFDVNYKKYVEDLIVLSADDTDLLLSFTIQYVNKYNIETKLIENEI